IFSRDWSSDVGSSDLEVAGAAIVEIQPRDGVVRTRVLGLFFQADDLALAVELGHAVALRIADPVAEHRRAVVTRIGPLQDLGEELGRASCSATSGDRG